MLTQYESELLSAYIDRELHGEELAIVQEKLAVSTQWKKEFENLKQLKSRLLIMPNVSAPDDLVSSMQQIWIEKAKDSVKKNERKWTKSWKWPLTGGIATVTAAIVIVISLRLFHTATVKPIPAEILIAAHTGQGLDAHFYQNIIAASDYSREFKNHE